MIIVRMVMMMISTIAGDGRWMDGRMDGWIDGWMGEGGKGSMWMWVAVSFWSVGWTEVTAVRAAGKQQEGKVMVGRLGG